MNILKIAIIVIIIIYLVIGIETFVKLKTSENKRIEDVRNSLIIRINIIMVLTIVLSILSILLIIFNN